MMLCSLWLSIVRRFLLVIEWKGGSRGGIDGGKSGEDGEVVRVEGGKR